MAFRVWDSVLVEHCISSRILIARLHNFVWHFDPWIQSCLSLIADGLYLDRYISKTCYGVLFTTSFCPIIYELIDVNFYKFGNR